MTVWLREAASGETLRALLSLGLLLYAVWHVTKAAFFRPGSPFDWTRAERELLAAMPLLPRDLVAYQLASVTVTTIFKAGLFTLLLLPDLHCLSLGVVGLVLALMTLEILRMAVDIATWGMGRAGYLVYRTAVIAGLIVGGLAIGTVVVRDDSLTRINVGEGLLERLVEILVRLNASVVGHIALPFQPLITLILSDSITAANMRLAAAASVTVTGLAAAVIGLYALTAQRAADREKRNYHPSGATCEAFASSNLNELGLRASTSL